MVLGTQRQWTAGLTRALAWPFIVLRVPPNAITIFTLVPATVTAWLVWQQFWFWALAVGTLTASMDFLDGAVARATGRISRFGGVLDSVIDRYVDVMFLLGIGLALDHDGGWLATGAATLGTVAISYVRARTLQEVPDVPARTWNQMMERPERIILLGLGVLGQGIVQVLGAGWEVLYWTVIVYAVFTNLTVVRRLVAAGRLMSQKGF